MNSFMSWVGGKSLSRPVILPRFPANYERYIEVFGGGGWILFAKKPELFEVYNDVNSNLYNLFGCVRYRPAAFLRQLGVMPCNARKEFDVLIKHINGDDSVEKYIQEEMGILADFEYPKIDEIINLLYDTESAAEPFNARRAADFYKVIRYSYASGCTSYSCQPCDISSYFHQITLANKRLNGNCATYRFNLNKADDTGNGVIIENKDFESLISQYDRPESFFYCDPPYYEAEGCYAHVFSKEDHYRLKDTLSGIKGKFLLSYNDCEFIRALYADYEQESFQRLNSISQRYDAGGTYGELLVANYNMRERLEKNPCQIALF